MFRTSFLSTGRLLGRSLFLHQESSLFHGSSAFSGFAVQQAEDFDPDKWGKAAAEYDRAFGSKFRSYAREGLRRIHSDGGLNGDVDIIDVGCGPGPVLQCLSESDEISEHVKSLHAVDFSSEMVHVCRENYKDLCESGAQVPPLVDIAVMNGQDLKYNDSAFDIAVAFFSVMFFPNRAAGLQELVRVLRPGGKALVAGWAPAKQIDWISFSNRAVVNTVGKEVIGKIIAMEPGVDPRQVSPNFAVWSNPTTFHDELVLAGFENVAVEPVTQRFDLGYGAQGIEKTKQTWMDMCLSFPTLSYVVTQAAKEMDCDETDLKNQIAEKFSQDISHRGDGECWVEGTAHFGWGSAPEQ